MRTDEDWERWGQTDPYFGVLTDERYRSTNLTEESRIEFFRSGRLHVDHVWSTIRKHVDPDFSPARALDFGCGVGRVLIPLAERCAEVVGTDVAESMLREAQANCGRHEVRNAVFVPADDELSAVDGDFGLVHSCIVLQHIQPERGIKIFGRMVGRIQPGGVGAIQVTFADGRYAFDFGQPPRQLEGSRSEQPGVIARGALGLRGLVFGVGGKSASPPKSDDPAMDMYYYNFSKLFFVLQMAGVERLHVEMTDHGGALGAFLFFRVGRQSPAAQR